MSKSKPLARALMETPVTGFAVIAAKGFMTARGVFWSGVLVRNGLPVCQFENRADGGCLWLDWRPGADVPAIEAELRQLTEETFEPTDAAIGALWDAAYTKVAA